MKKVIAVLLTLSLLLVSAACGYHVDRSAMKPLEEKHTHKWENATCTSAKTCRSCGETEGEAHGHCWLEATCTEAKTCEVCGAVEGAAVGHRWTAATCMEAKTCEVCGATEGETIGHVWLEATCTEAATCEVCGETEGKAHGHSWTDATCTEAKTCEVCGATEDAAPGHNWVDATCTEAKTCEVCGETEGKAHGHSWTDATCTEAKTCKVCGETEGGVADHTPGDWIVDQDATCAGAGIQHTACRYCGTVITIESIPQKEHTYGEWTVETSAGCEEDGVRYRICSGCLYKEVETVPGAGHEKKTLISAESSGSEFLGIWLCGRCGESFAQPYDPLTATFEKSVTYNGSFPTYSVYVTATGGLGEYEYQYVLYNKQTGQIIDTLRSKNNAISFTDYSNAAIYANTLAVRVYIIDAVGEVAYDFNLNDGNFGSDGVLHYAYRLNGGTFSGIDYQG